MTFSWFKFCKDKGTQGHENLFDPIYGIQGHSCGCKMIFSTPQKWKTKKSLRGPKRALRGMNIFYPIYGAQGPYSIVMQLYCSPASFYALMYKANSWRMTSSVYVLIIIFALLKGHILYFHTKQYSYPFNLRHRYNFMFFSRKQIRHLTMLYSTLTNWILYFLCILPCHFYKCTV